MQACLPIDRSDGFYTCSSGGLGFGIPAAVGVALGNPGQKVIALIGDGSSMYAIQGLWTAGQFQLPITFVIIRNGRYQALEEFGPQMTASTTGRQFARSPSITGRHGRRPWHLQRAISDVCTQKGSMPFRRGTIVKALHGPPGDRQSIARPELALM
jgi:thiamine pyrophosphate-dependent acetolactate synthase large subunit-like protein